MNEKNEVNTSKGRTISTAILYVLLICCFIFYGVVVFNDLPGDYHPYMTFITITLSISCVSGVYAAAPTIVYGWDK